MKIRLYLFAFGILFFGLQAGIVADNAVLEIPRKDILPGVDARIEQYRTGPIDVVVRDGDGQPVPNALIEVRMVRHQFLFGCNIFMHSRFNDPEQEQAYRDQFEGLFNFATLPFYWKNFERRQGAPDNESWEEVARWCLSRGIRPKGHPLVWNHVAGVPTWLPEDHAEIRKLSNERVEACVTRFKKLINVWDVFNEATDPMRFNEDNKMTDAFADLGVIPWVIESFQIAREANPDATLLINDYRTDQAYVDLIEQLKADGKPVYDVIGIQSHMHGGVWSAEHTWDVCQRFARFGVPLHFTETTVVSGPRGEGGAWEETTPELEERQAEQVVGFYRMLFSHPAVEAITWWDFSDRGAWQGAAAGMLRKDLTPKPVYSALRQLVREDWWTDVVGTTDSEGKFTARGFYGDYEISASIGGRKVAVELRHDREGPGTQASLVLR